MYLECLEILGELIQNNGMMVCQPTPQKSVPIIAKQITDRDNTVRSAALNTMVFVHAYIGEGVYKFTSQVNVCNNIAHVYNVHVHAKLH